MNNKALGIITAATMILAGTIDSSSDKASENDAYCQNVARHDRDASHGIPPKERAGWPNYKELDCREVIAKLSMSSYD